MADEDQLRRYLTTGDGSPSLTTGDETNQPSSSQDNANEDSQVRPRATSEEKIPWHTTSAGSSDTAHPRTSSAAHLQQSAVSDDWIYLLNDWVEKNFDNLQPTWFLDCTNGVPLSTADDTLATRSSASEHVDSLQSGSTAFWNPMENTGASLTPPSASQESVVQGPGISGNNARRHESYTCCAWWTSGATSNFQANMEYHQADDPFFAYDVYDNGSAGAHNRTSIRSDWDAVANTSRADIVQPSAALENYSRVPPGSPNLQGSASYGHVRMSQYGVASIEPWAYSSVDSIAALESMLRRLEMNEESVTLINGARSTDTAAEEPPRHCSIGSRSHPVVQETNHAGPSQDNASGDLQIWPTVTPQGGGPMLKTPGRSHDTAQPGTINTSFQPQRAGYATDCTQNEKRQDVSGVHGDVNRGKKPSGERRHKCEICDKSFKKKYNLARHRHVHTGVKPYLCGICGESFARKHSLKVHSRAHTGEKPFKCTICTKSFAGPANLRAHERTHRSDRPYKCEMCAHSSKTKSNLKNHQRKHRGEDT